MTPAALKKIREHIQPFLADQSLRWSTKLENFPPAAFHQLLHGDGKSMLGILTLLEKAYCSTTAARKRKQLETFRDEVPCSACRGTRLRPEAGAVRLGDLAIHEITALPVRKSLEFFQQLEFDAESLPVAEPLIEEITRRLQFLVDVGIGYLSLDRAADTLSGGELQRVRLATGIGCGLVGVCYILDEPSIGLHPRDNARLIRSLRELQQQRNTVIVVEHDEAVMREADEIIDMGPAAGRHGGQIVVHGTVDVVARHEHSLTGRYLSGRRRIETPSKRRKVAKSRSLVLEGATINNLKDVSVRIPLGVLTCVTGVSGSGKSSLINETLAKAVARRLNGSRARPGPHRGLRGVNLLDKIVRIDQSAIGRSPRSNPATYTGVFDEIRKVFAGTRQARQKGFSAGRFSFNVKGGRCETCQGQGLRKIEMNFLPDLYVTCEDCQGARFNRQTLAVRYKGLNIAGVLDMRIEDAAEFFENFSVIARMLASLNDVGLGYLTLGQASHNALRRRSAANQVGHRVGPGRIWAIALLVGRTNDRIAPGGYPTAAASAANAGRPRKQRYCDRASLGRDQMRRPYHRSGPGRGRGGRLRGSGGHPGTGRRRPGKLDRPVSARHAVVTVVAISSILRLAPTIQIVVLSSVTQLRLHLARC